MCIYIYIYIYHLSVCPRTRLLIHRAWTSGVRSVSRRSLTRWQDILSRIYPYNKIHVLCDLGVIKHNGVNTNGAAAKVMHLTDCVKRYALALLGRQTSVNGSTQRNPSVNKHMTNRSEPIRADPMRADPIRPLPIPGGGGRGEKNNNNNNSNNHNNDNNNT